MAGGTLAVLTAFAALLLAPGHMRRDAASPATGGAQTPSLPPTPAAPMAAAAAAPVPAPARAPAPAPVLAAAPGAGPAAGPVAVPAPAPEDPAAALQRLAVAAGWAWVDGVQALVSPQAAARPTIALVGYDALVAAGARNSGLPLRVLTPLYTEPLRFTVPAASALRHLHQIEKLPIDAGPPQSRAAQTAEAAYRALFNHAPPASGPGAGLRMALGGPLPPGRRVLTLDPAHPSTQRALRRFLPAGDGSLAVMDFLVVRADSPAPAVTAFGASLCQALPALRRDGAPAWRQVRPGQQLPAPWPEHQAAGAAFAGCNATGAATTTAFTTTTPPAKGERP